MDIIKSIQALAPNAQVSCNAEDYEQITWHDGNPNNITVDQIKAKQAELKADYEAKEYQRTRAKSYPLIEEQLDMQYWDSVNGTTKWKDAVAKVKEENPK
jgi:hypothetical protein